MYKNIHVISYWLSFATESIFSGFRDYYALSVLVSRIVTPIRLERNNLTSLTFQGHVTSSVMRPFDSLYAIFYWWSSETKPSLTVSEIFNIQRRPNGWRDLDTTSKQRSRSFILVPINFSYTTFPYTTSFPEYIIHLHLTVLIVTLSVVSRRVMWISIFIIMKLYIA